MRPRGLTDISYIDVENDAARSLRLKVRQSSLWDTVYDLAIDQVGGRIINEGLTRRINREYVAVSAKVARLEGDIREAEHLENVVRGLAERRG